MDLDKALNAVKSLSRNKRACTYYRADLHIHSPDSDDYRGDTAVTPYEFVSRFIEHGFDLIAITDHNTGKYIDEAIEARDQISHDSGENITVLPGVELYVSPGIHVLAILPEGGSAEVSDLLSYLGLHIEHHGDMSKLISKPIGEVARIVHNRGGLLIGAHCNSTNGIVEELDGQPRLEWLRAVDALEINAGTEEDSISKTVDYVSNVLGVSIPFTFGSDFHGSEPEPNGMWVKMATPSLASLRQLIYEPELRVSRIKPVTPTHGRIIGFTITQGIYANQRFRFSPHLNVLLGGRGAGKSAAIDLLRFAFEAEPRDGEDIKEGFANRIMGFLKLVGEVLVVIMGSDGECYVITRSGKYEKSSARAAPTFTERARVYQVADDGLIPREASPLHILGIEFYGQGEVAQLADRVDEQLRLIDENLNHSDANASITEAWRSLEEDEEELTRLNQRLEELRVEAASRKKLEERRDLLAKSLANPIFAERSRWDRERLWVEGRQDWLQRILDAFPDTVPPPTDAPIDIEESSAKVILKKVLASSDRILGIGQSELNRFREMLMRAMSEVKGYRSEWDDAFEIAENEFYARLIELEAENLDQASAEQRSINEKLTYIETTIEPEIEEIGTTITLLQERRVTLLEKLRDARSSIGLSRSAFVEELNSSLGGDVLIDLTGSDTARYVNAVDIPLQGSGMMRRGDQVSLACEALMPEKFVEIIRACSIDKLTEIGITENNASRMVDTLSDKDLFEIERVEVPPLPSIRIKREGEDDYTDLTSLSVGEKCSAILSIALLSKGKPLIIDQPEDDLDHAFIIDSIVAGIRNAKSARQIIAATHNPNIPVLGDAEMVFRVARQAGDDVCRIQNSGGLELPQITTEVQSLEGGAEAFERRRQRYSGVSSR